MTASHSAPLPPPSPPFLGGITASPSSNALHAPRSTIASPDLTIAAPLEPATVAALRSSLQAFSDASLVAPCARARMRKGMVFEGGERSGWEGGEKKERVERRLDGTVAKVTAGEVLLWVVVVLVV